MTPSNRRPGFVVAGATVAVLSVAAALLPTGTALSQQAPTMEHGAQGHGRMPGMMPEPQRPMMGMRRHGPAPAAAATPAMPGQDAFGAIQEIVRILEADPRTDWAKVDLDALRRHLVDMNEVTLHAEAATKPVDGGVEIAVTGAGRTLAGIQRMVPDHAQELDRIAGWSARTAPLPDGVLLTVTSSDPKEVAHIRGLGFFGLLASGAHHQPHHLAMARGERAHAH